MCKRCISKGLQCGGYPDKFRFCGIASRGKWKGHEAPVDVEATSAGSTPSSSNLSKQTVFERNEVLSSHSPRDAQGPQSSTPNGQSDITTILRLDKTDLLLKHCRFNVHVLTLRIDFDSKWSQMNA